MNNTAIKISEKWQLTLPNSIRLQLKVKPGDALVPTVRDGILYLASKKSLKKLKSQAWFWTSSWQAKEEEVDNEIKAKRSKKSKTVAALMEALKK